jgi:glycosyltransferase involved in cell wall biosynthesis
MRENARHIDVFLAPSRAHGAKMAELLQISPNKLRVVNVGIDASAFSGPRERARSPFSVGYLSIIVPRKGLDTLVDAVAILANEQKREIVLRIAGRVADDDYWGGVRRKLDDAHLWERTERTGELDLAGKVAFLNRCSAFTVPSRIEESRGMAVMEAMASGIPVLAPSSGVYPELTDSGKCGLLYAPRDTGSLVRGIARLMDSPSEADAMGAAASKRIAGRYSLAAMIDGIEAAYRDVTSPLGDLRR